MSTSELLAGVAELEREVDGAGYTEGAARGTQRRYNRNDPTLSTHQILETATLLRVAVTTRTAGESEVEVTDNAGNRFTAKLPPPPPGDQNVGAKGFMILHPEHGVMFRHDLYTGLRACEQERGGGDLSDNDAALLCTILGLLNTDEACQIGGDPATHRILCEALGLADPSGYGRPSIALQFSVEEGTPKGLARLLGGCMSILKVGLPPPGSKRAAEGLLRGIGRSLALHTMGAPALHGPHSLPGGKESGDQTGLAAALLGGATAGNGPTNLQVRATLGLLNGTGTFVSDALKVLTTNEEAQSLALEKVAASQGEAGSSGGGRISKAQIVAAASIIKGKHADLAGAANLLATAGGDTTFESIAVAATAARVVDGLVDVLQCPYLGRVHRGASALLIEVLGRLPKAESDIAVLVFADALTTALYDFRAKPSNPGNYPPGSLMAKGGHVSTIISAFNTHGLVPTAISEARVAGKRKEPSTTGGAAAPGATGAQGGQAASGPISAAGGSKKQAGACVDFIRGNCKYGATCKYIHDVNAACPRGASCTFLAKGSCFFAKH